MDLVTKTVIHVERDIDGVTERGSLLCIEGEWVINVPPILVYVYSTGKEAFDDGWTMRVGWVNWEECLEVMD